MLHPQPLLLAEHNVGVNVPVKEILHFFSCLSLLCHLLLVSSFQKTCGMNWEEVKKVKGTWLRHSTLEQRLEIVVVICKAGFAKPKREWKKRQKGTLIFIFFFNIFSFNDFQIQPAQFKSQKPIFLADAGDLTAKLGPFYLFTLNKTTVWNRQNRF